MSVSSADSSPVSPSLQDLGLRPSSPIQNTIFGKYRKCSEVTSIEAIFIVFSAVSIIGTTGLTIYRLVASGTEKEDRIMAVVLLINLAFSVWYIVSGMLREQPYELIGFASASIALVLYLVLNISFTPITTIKLTRLVAAGITIPILIGLACYIAFDYYLGSGFLFRVLGASSDLQIQCRRLFQTYSALMLDLQLQLSIVVLVLNSDQKVNSYETIVLVVGVIFGFFWSTILYFGMRMEARPILWVAWGLAALEPGYCIWRIYVSSKKIADNSEDQLGTKLGLISFTITVAVIAILVRISLLILTAFVYRNFGRGLKHKIYGGPVIHEAEPVASTSNS